MNIDDYIVILGLVLLALVALGALANTRRAMRNAERAHTQALRASDRATRAEAALAIRSRQQLLPAVPAAVLDPDRTRELRPVRGARIDPDAS